jgi:SAM-dependent methyltransferase
MCKNCGGEVKLEYKNLFDNRHGYPGKFDIYRCLKCGFRHTVPELKQQQISKIYSQYYPRQNITADQILRQSKIKISRSGIWLKGLGTTCHLATARNEKVLDIGCGTCQSLLEIKLLGGEPWGIDPDVRSENIAKTLGLNFFRGTLDSCPFPKKYFDLITASQVLEHIPDPKVFLEICKKYLRKNGRIRLSFPNVDSLGNILFKSKWLNWHIPYHLNHFSRKSVSVLLKKCGYRLISLRTVTPNLWTILQIRQLLSKQQEGVRDVIWDTGEEGKQANNKGVNLLSVASKVVENGLVINRLIDSLNRGESFVVEIRPKI